MPENATSHQNHHRPKSKQTKQTNTPSTHPTTSTSTSPPEPPIFFWKETEENGHLCQWFPCTFIDPSTNITYKCAEQYMMYHKALTFSDFRIAAQILKTTSPRKQKGLGGQVADFDDERWSEVRSGIVERGNLLKFGQCTNVTSIKMDDPSEPVPLKELLLATGDRELVEASPFDRVWGIGFRATEALQVPRSQWGENLLGKALMKVREELRREAS